MGARWAGLRAVGAGAAVVRAVVACVVVVVSAACADHEFEPPDRQARVERAAEAYSAALFDSIEWTEDDRIDLVGNEVYAGACRRCHGDLGRGDTPYARERGIEPPSLVQPDWPLADRDAVRRAVYTGHEAGMPIYGEGGLTPRQIDAVAAYVVDVLRPEVLGDEGEG